LKSGFSHGYFVYADPMRIAPQETRTYLVTAVTAERRSHFQVTATAELFERTLLDYRSQGKYLLHAFVIMPEHVHALITPSSDVSLEKGNAVYQGRVFVPLEEQTRCVDAQLQREPDPEQGKVRELCAVH
jgi:putative transposase